MPTVAAAAESAGTSGIEPVSLPPMAASVSGRRWVMRAFDPEAAHAIESQVGCPPALARLLAARGVRAEAAARYLDPSLRDHLPDPSALKDMDRAAARIADAIRRGERCGVFGDYDVDGACGSAILKMYFSEIGAPLDVYLPDRILEGYGPSEQAFRTLMEGGASLVMTVDCGAAAHDAINAAAGDGLEIIVLDHHQMDGAPPARAFATVNPNRPDDSSGLKTLSAAGVAFMTVVAVNRALRELGHFDGRRPPDLLRLLDLVALGLVCDVMPMTGLARVLTAQGLKVLAGDGNPGLKALGARCGVGAKPSVYDLGFLLGPRINAAGRIGHARLAFELLTTPDAARRTELAERLHVMNAERQQIEKDVQDAAIALIEREGLHHRPVIVAAGQGWHPGVIGIVAGRIKDRYERPAVVIGLDGAVGKGSARSLSGVDIGAAFRAAKDAGLLAAGGGHAMAAGLTISADAVAAFAGFLEATCKDDVERALMDRARLVDGVVAASAVSAAFAELIDGAGPFGPENPEPVFALTSVRVERTRLVGSGHLACEISDAMGERVRGIAFRAAGEPLGEALLKGGRLHLAGRIKADSWRGGGAGQFQIIDAAEALA